MARRRRWIPWVLTGLLLACLGLVMYAGVMARAQLQWVREHAVLWPDLPGIAVDVIPEAGEDVWVTFLLTNRSPGPASFHLSWVGTGREKPLGSGRLLTGQSATLPVMIMCQVPPYSTFFLQTGGQGYTTRTWFNAAYFKTRPNLSSGPETIPSPAGVSGAPSVPAHHVGGK